MPSSSSDIPSATATQPVSTTEPSYIPAPSNSLNIDEIEIDSDFSEEHSPVLNEATPAIQASNVTAPFTSTHDSQNKSQTTVAQVSSNTPTFPPKPEIDANINTNLPEINPSYQPWKRTQQQGEENEQLYTPSTKEQVVYTAPNGRTFTSAELSAYSTGVKIDNKLIYFQPNFIQDDPWADVARLKERDEPRRAKNGNNSQMKDIDRAHQGSRSGSGYDPSTQSSRGGLSGDVRNEPGFVDTGRHGGYGAMNERNNGRGGGKRVGSDWWGGKDNGRAKDGGTGRRGGRGRGWRSATASLRGGEGNEDTSQGEGQGEW